jgi:hypothetical protein
MYTLPVRITTLPKECTLLVQIMVETLYSQLRVLRHLGTFFAYVHTMSMRVVVLSKNCTMLVVIMINVLALLASRLGSLHRQMQQASLCNQVAVDMLSQKQRTRTVAAEKLVKPQRDRLVIFYNSYIVSSVYICGCL